MADDDRPLRHYLVLLVWIRLSLMNQEHGARQMSEWHPVLPFSIIIDRWALQHDSRPASIRAVAATVQTRSQSSAPMPALR